MLPPWVPAMGSLPSVSMAAFRPMTWPRALTSGPPELPGLIGASVWIASKKTGRLAFPDGRRGLDWPVDSADDPARDGVGQAEG